VSWNSSSSSSSVRTFLIALPFNFRTSVFDAIAPHSGSGRFALVSNVFQLFLGEQQQQQPPIECCPTHLSTWDSSGSSSGSD
jgi:hypothetical protein